MLSMLGICYVWNLSKWSFSLTAQDNIVSSDQCAFNITGYNFTKKLFHSSVIQLINIKDLLFVLIRLRPGVLGKTASACCYVIKLALKLKWVWIWRGNTFLWFSPWGLKGKEQNRIKEGMKEECDRNEMVWKKKEDTTGDRDGENEMWEQRSNKYRQAKTGIDWDQEGLRSVERNMSRCITRTEWAWHQGRNCTDRQGGVRGGWTRTTRREGVGGVINRVAIPPSSESEAERFHCLRYLSWPQSQLEVLSYVTGNDLSTQVTGRFPAAGFFWSDRGFHIQTSILLKKWRNNSLFSYNQGWMGNVHWLLGGWNQQIDLLGCILFLWYSCKESSMHILQPYCINRSVCLCEKCPSCVCVLKEGVRHSCRPEPVQCVYSTCSQNQD